ncbi:MAG: DNA helicase UvrD [Thermodesulfobacteria bacterium]|nr:DNA helicase UvrD [Thermodesulfobacteriota bacterium]
MKEIWPPWPRNAFLADFHIHSKYSRATSKDMEPLALNETAKLKGIQVVGTGDFTHPGYLKELEEKLEPAEEGLFVCKDDPEGTRFILTAEVSNIYTWRGKGRRIHTVLFAPNFEVVRDIQARLKAIGNISADGRPIFGFPAKELVRLVMEASPECFVVPAHVWTPWFSLFGARSGFDSVEECFEELSCHIHALETGLSSDPQMNWRLSSLDDYTLISNSDAHSPWKLGREVNVFTCDMNYHSIIEAMKVPKKGFQGTIEFFPEEGKYHFDGHRACNICFSPAETKRHKGICPVCKRPLTVGVCHRVDDLADRPEGFVPKGALPNIHLIPLEEMIAQAFGVKSITKRVHKEYLQLLDMAGTEFDVLIWEEEEELRRRLPEELSERIIAMRQERVEVSPGYDGVYGRITPIVSEEKAAKPESKTKEPDKKDKKTRPRQKSLF